MQNSIHSIINVIGVCLIASQAFGTDQATRENDPYVIVLGTAQDAGYPQAGCQRECCRAVIEDPALRRFATSLALVDPQTKQRWLFDCTPDFREQLQLLNNHTVDVTATRKQEPPALDGIFLTHAHVGHYAGLIHLGREVIGARAVPVFAMPRLREFLSSNGPWSQLVGLKNIQLRPLAADQKIQLNDRLAVTPIQVPHRDEFSETVGFIIAGPDKTVLFIPDIDKWERWDRSIETLIRQCDIAYLDGTFYANGEIPGRDMSQIPHPFIEESLQRFSSLSLVQKNRIRFIHMNHTNPALRVDTAARRVIRDTGMRTAEQAEIHRI